MRFVTKFVRGVAWVLLWGALLLLAYPFVSNVYSQRVMDTALSDQRANVADLTPEDFSAEIAKAVEYDDNLIGRPLHDPFNPEGGYVLPDDYNNVLNVNGDGVMGSISIPKIKVDLPIFHGVGEDSLQKGVGHIEYSSTIWGGKGRHSFLSAHRGLPNSLLFTDLNLVEKGDKFFIEVLGETHAYQVRDIEVILPSEFTSTRPTPGEDLVTLITCTPYAINTHRLLVTGERVPFIPDDELDVAPVTASVNTLYVILALVPVLALVIALILKVRSVAKRGKQK